MNDHIAVIEQEPARVGFAFFMVRPDSGLLKDLSRFFQDGAELSLTVPGHDDEVIRETADFANVQEDDVGGLLISRGVHGFSGDIERFQGFSLRRSHTNSIP